MTAFVFADVETTGLFSSDRIVSLAAIRVPSDEVLAPKYTIKYLHLVFDPGRKSHPRAEAVHGLDDWFLRHQSPITDSSESIQMVFSGTPTIVAHNASFDRQFIEREFAEAGLQLTPERYVCTMQQFRATRGGRASLDAILPHLGMQRSSDKHGAFEDAWHAFQIYRWLNGATPTSFPQDWPVFGNIRQVPPRPDPLPRRSRKTKVIGARPLHPAAQRLRPLALLLDFVARADGRVETEIDVLTDFLRSEDPAIPEGEIPDVVASWVETEITETQLRACISGDLDKAKLAEWLRKLVNADGYVSPAEVEATRTIVSMLP